MNNNGFIKGLLLVLLGLYIVSPLDLAAGPVDDLLMLLFTVAVNMRKSGRKELPPVDLDKLQK